MQFLKKNYEKILLGLVLFGLVAAVASLPFLVGNEKQRLTALSENITHRAGKEPAALNLNRWEELLKRFDSRSGLDLSTTNKVFNPVLWLRAADGHPIKAEGNTGPERMTITNVVPLYFTIKFDSVMTSETPPQRYVISVANEAAARADQRRPRLVYAAVGEKKEVFTVKEIKGAPENPDELILELADTGEKVSITKDKPFKHVSGYAADLKYEPEKKSFPNRRKDSSIGFGGENYIILDITQNEVVLSATSNNKKYTVKNNASP